MGVDDGFDALEGRYGNMIDMGIIDPLRVCRSALQNGASVAGLLLTTNTLIAEEQTPWGGSRALMTEFGSSTRVCTSRRRTPARRSRSASDRRSAESRLPGRGTGSRSAAGSPSELTVDGEASALQLLRSRGRMRGVVALLGPAFVAAVAYIDPGNFATNFSAGAKFGYALIWVIVAANLMAMIVQYLSAKTGVATGRDLPELCREHLPRPVSRGLWVQAEIIAMATDLAEFVGAAVGLNLLFGVPLFPAGLDHGGRRLRHPRAGAARISALRAGHRRPAGHRPARLRLRPRAVGADASAVAAGLVPSFPGGDGVLLAAGIIGATVMPHVVYLHSALTKSRVQCRDDAERFELLRFQRLDVVVGLGIAGLINLSMLMVAASVFHSSGSIDADSIEAAHAGLGELVGGGAALAFAVALLASGLSSSSVGTYAGQVVMQGFIRRRIPLMVRRGGDDAARAGRARPGAAGHRQPGGLAGRAVLRHPVRAGAALDAHPARATSWGRSSTDRITTFTVGGIAAMIIALNVYLLYDLAF